MKKHITVTGVLFLAVLFVLPITAFGRTGRAKHHPGRMMALMLLQKQVQTQTLTTEQISQIDVIRKKLQDDNAAIMKQLMAEKQKEITAKIQAEINNIDTKRENT